MTEIQPQLKTPTVEQLVAAIIPQPEPRPTFKESLWPFTYATDILREHPEIVPLEVHREFFTNGGAGGSMTPHQWEWTKLRLAIDSRATASRIRKVWAYLLGIRDSKLAEILATVYCTRRDIEIPELYRRG
jgi:hypothetical protein